MAREKILILASHCDDAEIFMWPAFLNDDFERELFVCSTDLNNPDRAWCSHRKNTTIRLCAEFGIEFDCLDYPSEFYRLPTRDGQLDEFYMRVAKKIQHTDADIIFTHNPHGEYGHLDHKLVWDIAFNYSPTEMWFSDVCQRSNWPSDISIKNLARHLFYRNKIGTFDANEEQLTYCINEYKKDKVFTWDENNVPKQMGVYRL